MKGQIDVVATRLPETPHEVPVRPPQVPECWGLREFNAFLLLVDDIPWDVRFDGRNLGDRRDLISESELGDAQYYRLTARGVDFTVGVRF